MWTPRRAGSGGRWRFRHSDWLRAPSTWLLSICFFNPNGNLLHPAHTLFERDGITCEFWFHTFWQITQILSGGSSSEWRRNWVMLCPGLAMLT